MADPSRLDFADWFSVVAAALVAGMGGAMGFFQKSNARRDTRIHQMEDTMRTMTERQSVHTTEIAVVQTCQENTARQLEAINETTRDTNQSIKDLSATLTQALLSMQANGK